MQIAAVENAHAQETVGCGNCPDKYLCGGCRARAYSHFKGNARAPDIGYIHNKPLWKRIVK